MKNLNEKELPIYAYWSNYEKALKLGFTEEEIKEASKKCNLEYSDVSEIKGFQEESHIFYKTHQFVKKSHQYHERRYCNNGEQLMNGKTVSGIGVRVPSNYQGNTTKNILMELMKNRYDWFDSFIIDKNYTEKPLSYAYSIGRLTLDKLTEEHKNLTGHQLIELANSSIEIQRAKSAWEIYDLDMLYLSTKNGSIYVPLEAILKSDIDIVIDRMTKYFKSYHSDKSRVAKSLLPLKTEEFNQLKNYLNARQSINSL